jgi:ubiquitin-activating enzyme E1
MPQVLDFKSFSDSFADPEYLISDFAKFDRPAQLHLCFAVLDDFKEKFGRLPLPRNEKDALEFLELVKTLSTKLKNPPNLDEKLIKEFSFQARGDLPPMNAVLGGFVAQEVLKACSGKFTPLFQYLYFDSLESFPKSINVTEDDCKPIGSRYDPQIAVFGKRFQSILSNQRQFLVGAGAMYFCFNQVAAKCSRTGQ